MMDNEKVSDVTLPQVASNMNQYWSLCFAVASDARNVGGLTLFGKNFGNYAQDILMRVFYEKKCESAADDEQVD